MFPEHGITVSLCDSFSSEDDLVQARVTLDETLTIPPFSMLETIAHIHGKVRGQAGLLQECKTKQLPVRIANGLVCTSSSQVPVRLLNPSSDCVVIYRGTKIATVEEVEPKPSAAISAVQEKDVSRRKRQALNEMVMECASDLLVEQKEQLLQVLLE